MEKKLEFGIRNQELVSFANLKIKIEHFKPNFNNIKTL